MFLTLEDDLRYILLILGCIKAGYKVSGFLPPHTRNHELADHTRPC